jgi:hypothetical protein
VLQVYDGERVVGREVESSVAGEDCTEMIDIGFIIVSSVVGFADSGQRIQNSPTAFGSD